jgi:hypothetical protein
LNYNEERCFLRGPLREVINGTFDERPGIFIRDKPIFSSERMLHKDYDRKDSAEKKKKSLVMRLKGLDAKTTDWR